MTDVRLQTSLPALPYRAAYHQGGRDDEQVLDDVLSFHGGCIRNVSCLEGDVGQHHQGHKGTNHLQGQEANGQA